ncbi:MAG: hypothetical protein VYC79_00485 [Bacteroidota bacterium]|nr:hypothetical protein [Bacteroidota bacterium]
MKISLEKISKLKYISTELIKHKTNITIKNFGQICLKNLLAISLLSTLFISGAITRDWNKIILITPLVIIIDNISSITKYYNY